MADVAQRLQAAIEVLSGHITATVQAGAVSSGAAIVGLRMMPAVRDLLRYDLALVERSEGEQLEKVLSAFDRAGDAALMAAVLGLRTPAPKLSPAESARVAVFGFDTPEEP